MLFTAPVQLSIIDQEQFLSCQLKRLNRLLD